MRNKKEILDEAAIIEQEVSGQNAFKHRDFEWGVLNGKLKTLRWVLGEDWGNLDS